MLKCILNCLLFIFWALRLLCILGFRLIKTLPYINTTFLFYLCNIKV